MEQESDSVFIPMLILGSHLQPGNIPFYDSSITPQELEEILDGKSRTSSLCSLLFHFVEILIMS